MVNVQKYKRRNGIEVRSHQRSPCGCKVFQQPPIKEEKENKKTSMSKEISNRSERLKNLRWDNVGNLQSRYNHLDVKFERLFQDCLKVKCSDKIKRGIEVSWEMLREDISRNWLNISAYNSHLSNYEAHIRELRKELDNKKIVISKRDGVILSSNKRNNLNKTEMATLEGVFAASKDKSFRDIFRIAKQTGEFDNVTNSALSNNLVDLWEKHQKKKKPIVVPIAKKIDVRISDAGQGKKESSIREDAEFKRQQKISFKKDIENQEKAIAKANKKLREGEHTPKKRQTLVAQIDNMFEGLRDLKARQKELNLKSN